MSWGVMFEDRSGQSSEAFAAGDMVSTSVVIVTPDDRRTPQKPCELRVPAPRMKYTATTC